MIRNRPKRVLMLIIGFSLLCSSSVLAISYQIEFGGNGPGAGQYSLGEPLALGFPYTVSKWNQPRNVAAGTNPHRGTDVHADYGSDVLAVCDGWITAQAGYKLTLACDRDGDFKNDDDLKIQYNHLSKVNFIVSPQLRITKGTKIAESGDEGGKYTPHLHFGAMGPRTPASPYLVWFQNEPYYRANSHWNYGRDLDYLSRVIWINGSTTTVRAYGMNDSGAVIDMPQGNVVVFHRKAGTSLWKSGIMVKSGKNQASVFSYNFNKEYKPNTVIHYTIRATRAKLDVYDDAFLLPKYSQPSENPNATANKYDYYQCTIGGTCSVVTTP